MTAEEIIRARHSIRAFDDKKIEGNVKEELLTLIQQSNKEGGIHLELVTDEPEAFGNSRLAHYGKFKNVRNYVVLMCQKSDKKGEEKTGYYGEKLVLKAEELGLHSCWVGLTYSKGDVKCEKGEDEKITLLIALGYSNESGKTHKIKTPEQICPQIATTPEWFKKGVEMALLAPTAMNQQKFVFTYMGEQKVKAEKKWGFYTKVDLGIAKAHFEIGANTSNVKVDWV